MEQPWPENSRIILHLDMDAFYAAIEELDNPELVGKPVVVGADPRGGKGRGVVSTANYEARKYGIHSAMPISQAYRRCPHAAYLPGRYDRYGEISRHIMAILRQFSPIIQQISIDEAFLDLTGATKLLGQPLTIARAIKQRIRDDVGLTASVGIAPNKFLAKVASDLEKPDGLTICYPGSEKAFLAPLPIRRLWGVGEKTAERLQRFGIKTIGDLAALPQEMLIKNFGKWGLHLSRLSQGIDTRPVEEHSMRKSISEETTFAEDVADPAVVEKTLFVIADQLSRAMRRKGLRGRTITLKLRLEGFITFTRSRTLPEFVDDADTLRSVAVDQFRRFEREGKRVRLVGIGVSHLNTIGGEQLSLFAESQPPRNEKLERVLDELKSKFGDQAATRASLLGEKQRPPDRHRD